MDKDFLSGAAYILGGIAIGATIWKVAKKIWSSPINYDDILSESINKAISLLQSESSSNEQVIGNLLIAKRIREGQAEFCLIRRYGSGRTTLTVLSPVFNISICPMDIQDEFENKNEIVIKKIELS